MYSSGIGSLASYDHLEQVGEGTYGYVYRATDRRSGDVVALKRLIIHKENSGFPLCAVREIKFLKSLQHKNIVKLRDIATSKGCENLDTVIVPDPSKALAAAAAVAAAGDKGKEVKEEIPNRHLQRCGSLYLVFEYVEHDLGGLVDAKYKFSILEIKCIMKQLFSALEYLMEKKIMHRDIKSSNILLSDRHVLKLADFGLARSSMSSDGREGKVDLTNNVITIWYKPPELLMGDQRYSYPVDMWSAGCVLAELELGRPLFPGKSDIEQLHLIVKHVGSPSENTWQGLSGFSNFESFNSLPKYPTGTSNLRTIFGQKISDPVLSLLERILDLDPLNIAPGTSLHEYETKQKRKREEEAKKDKKIDEISISENLNTSDVVLKKSASGVDIINAPSNTVDIASVRSNNNYNTAKNNNDNYYVDNNSHAMMVPNYTELVPQSQISSNVINKDNDNNLNNYKNYLSHNNNIVDHGRNDSIVIIKDQNNITSNNINISNNNDNDNNNNNNIINNNNSIIKNVAYIIDNINNNNPINSYNITMANNNNQNYQNSTRSVYHNKTDNKNSNSIANNDVYTYNMNNYNSDLNNQNAIHSDNYNSNNNEKRNFNNRSNNNFSNLNDFGNDRNVANRSDTNYNNSNTNYTNSNNPNNYSNRFITNNNISNKNTFNNINSNSSYHNTSNRNRDNNNTLNKTNLHNTYDSTLSTPSNKPVPGPPLPPTNLTIKNSNLINQSAVYTTSNDPNRISDNTQFHSIQSNSIGHFNSTVDSTSQHPQLTEYLDRMKREKQGK